jgi:hypothetical protein
VFSTLSIDAAIHRTKGTKYNPDYINKHSQKSLGIDPGFGSSKTAFVVTEWSDSQIKVLFAEEYERPQFDDMISKALELVDTYSITLKAGSQIFVDGVNPEFIRALKYQLHEDPE